MANLVEFKGLKHYPTGEANLAVREGKLGVSNIGTSGVDGFSVDVKGVRDWEMAVDQLSPSVGKTLSLNVKGMDSNGRSETIGGWCMYHNKDNGKWSIGINSRFCDGDIEIVGYDGDKEVYRKSFPVPDTPETNFLLSIVAWYVLEKSDFHHHDEAGDENDYTDYTYNSSSGSGGGGATPVELFNGDKFEATDIAIKTKRTVGNVPEGEKFKPAFLTFQGVNMDLITITNETITQ